MSFCNICHLYFLFSKCHNNNCTFTVTNVRPHRFVVFYLTNATSVVPWYLIGKSTTVSSLSLQHRL